LLTKGAQNNKQTDNYNKEQADKRISKKKKHEGKQHRNKTKMENMTTVTATKKTAMQNP
jgi:hypothetical protein